MGAIGFSMGAASLLSSIAFTTDIKSIISYASYAKTDDNLIDIQLFKKFNLGQRDRIKRRIVNILLSENLIKFSLKIYAFNFGSVSPHKSVRLFPKENHLYIIHGRKDMEVPVSHIYEIYRNAKYRNKDYFCHR